MKKMNYIVSCVGMVLLLTGCKDKIKNAYHKKAAACSAKVAGEAAKATIRHGYEVARTEGKRVTEHVTDVSKKVGKKVHNVFCQAGEGLKHVARVTTNTMHEIGSKTAKKVKGFVAHNRVCESCHSHNKPAEEVHKNSESIQLKRECKADVKEISEMSDIDHDEQE